MKPALPGVEVRAVFGDASDVTAEQIYEPVASASSGIWRIRAGTHTAILKLVRHSLGGHPHWQSGDDPAHWYYWRREVDAYESGLLASLAGGLRAPACRFVAERADGSIALWLEDLTGAAATAWPMERFATAALHLGRTQGEYTVGRALPSAMWLSRDWLRSYLLQRDGDFELVTDEAPWDRLPGSSMERVLGMRADQELFLGFLSVLPPTLCHNDLHPANLFADGDASNAAIDWSFVGIGTIGEDAGNLVADAVLDFHVPASQIGALYETVVSGFAAGLRDAGWRGDDDVVRMAMSATLAVKYAWIAPAILRAIADDRELLNRRPLLDAMSWWAPTVPFLLDRADEARTIGARRR